ncbi:RNA polymerase subunit sigma-70 [Haloferax volcanii]|uniref:RNA polymerase subunit sigma-70 n=1 Tax=Haloferax volcanii TaxID=2246 RepID=UPI00385319FC
MDSNIITEVYALPERLGLPYAFTRIDAVYIWTLGGYQVARNPDDYPIFVAVLESDVSSWQSFFEEYHIPSAFERQPETEVEGPLQVVLEPRPNLSTTTVEGHPVITLQETLEYARENSCHFGSAIPVLQEQYDATEE